MFSIYYQHKLFGKVVRTIIRGNSHALHTLIELNKDSEINFYMEPFNVK